MTTQLKHEWKQPFFQGLCPSQTDWAQLASFIDGEGSILLNTQKLKGGDRFYLRVMVANTDVRLMHWLGERFGGTYCDANTEKYYQGKNWKRSYHWGVCAARAGWILHNCMPYFVIKAEQAEIGIQMRESMCKFSRGGSRTSKFIPPEVSEERRSLKRRLLVLKARGVNTMPDQQKRIEEVS